MLVRPRIANEKISLKKCHTREIITRAANDPIADTTESDSSGVQNDPNLRVEIQFREWEHQEENAEQEAKMLEFRNCFFFVERIPFIVGKAQEKPLQPKNERVSDG